jgi:hypothetical protein
MRYQGIIGYIGQLGQTMEFIPVHESKLICNAKVYVNGIVFDCHLLGERAFTKAGSLFTGYGSE